MEIILTALLAMIPAIIVGFIFLIIVIKLETEEKTNKFQNNIIKNIVPEATKGKAASVPQKPKEIIEHFDAEWDRIIKPDGTEFFRKRNQVPNKHNQQVHKNHKNSQSKKSQTKPQKNIKTMPYSKRDILTNTEHKFWCLLVEKCQPYQIIICPKVRMEDFINVDFKQGEYSKYLEYRGRVKSRHIDFVLCDKYMNMIAGVELDDSSHLTEEAKKIDAFKDEVFKNLGIPLYRIKTNINYHEQINQMLKNITSKF